MNHFYFKKEKTIEVLESIRKGLVENQKTIDKAIELDKKEWEYEVDFDRLIKEVDFVKEKEYLPVFSKEKVVDGIGKIALLCNQNPYLIFHFILSCIYTNNKVEIVLENKMLATDKTMIEAIKKTLKTIKVDEDTVTYIELTDKEEIIAKQDNYDLIYYFGNKPAYLNFIKRVHVDTKFEEFGEIDVYADSKEFKEQIVEIDKWAYLNEMKINFYNREIEESISEMNKFNNINKMTMIFSKDLDKVAELVKKIKSERIYVNINAIKDYQIETNLNNLVYKKIIKW